VSSLMVNKIEWNDGMSVGVESIDNDHKKLILLIDALSNAIESGKESDVLEQLFDELADYAGTHFKREEALIKSCDYHDFDNHVKQHGGFADKIPELKSKLLSADSIDVALEVNLFLYQWLLNHILVDDMAFFGTLLDHGYVDKKEGNDSRISKLARKLSQNIQLGWRVLLSSLIPVTAFVLLAGIMIFGNVATYKNLRTVESLSITVSNINEVLKQLQTERGLTIGYLASKGLKLESELQQQRIQTDKLLIETINVIESHSTIYDYILGLQDVLPSIRSRVDQSSIGIKPVNKGYTTQVRYLIDFLGSMANLKMSNDLSNRLVALVTLSELSECIGQERALGLQMIEVGLKENDSFEYHNGRQQALFQTYMQFLHDFYSDEWSHQQESDAHILETKIERAIYQSTPSAFSQLSSLEWFKTHTNRIDDTSYLMKHLADEFNAIVAEKKKQLEFSFYLTTLFLIVMLFLSIMTSWLLNRSIILPVRKITNALSALARGEYDYRFTSSFGNDELSTMIDSYEYCRSSLLKSEVKSTIRFQRKDINLLSATYEKERYAKEASIDPLTGALNRRKFSEIANIIIGQSQRYNHPLSIMMLDIDFFKKVNDTYGHANGDTVLQEFVQTCQKCIRETDILARFGGEEFLILMPETDARKAMELAERIRKNISELTISTDGGNISLTVSIGVANWKKELSSSELENLADKALYEAKSTGRNRVVELIG